MESIDTLLKQNDVDWSTIRQRFELIQQRSKQIYADATNYVNSERRRIALVEERLAVEKETLMKDKEEFEDAREKVLRINQAFAHRILLVVGGKEFDTTHSTIMTVAENPLQDKADANSIIAVMLAKLAPCDSFTKIRIDRDPKFFDVILNYHRERSCVDRSTEQWAEDYLNTFTIAELQLIRSESEYYKIRSLSNYVTWFLVSREEKQKQLDELVQIFDTTRTKVLGLATKDDSTVEEKNFTQFMFRSIDFRNKYEFKGCVFRNAVFTRCRFSAHVLFSDCDIRGIRFIECTWSPSQALIKHRCLGELL